ncbi:non-hydrolyzing UDP-N-acetylglucosamine 2-epimerase [Marinobacterium sp. xm-a-152]|uniref:non-hydrolyzing UDP-N-acetylglucosamine 2-epimerase n=1 Tax=Marinobacterium sp. xm-a-152 TaxID=2497733 RepID=UPI0015694013|nr:UDP-N-acetylglucosamine 2-epimerase (non-hydrolyzing) [Marinobacterium sp. xm-a-152]NRP15023.1 UDP-2,3-diacetamido-2,3-dideoxy-D-glucuronate 2-epimerase [Marinobacterium sp. xm-a-152]
MKVLTIIGARPQFIKAAVVSRAFKEHRPDVQEILVHTGQHYDANMSDVFFDELEIPKPDYNLGIGGGTHGQNTGRMLEKLESLMLEVQPQWVLVYGDTDSTLAGALAAAKLHIPVAHIEAGLRSFNRKMPEEINRVMTDHIAEILFAPTETARQNLFTEGISEAKIKLVGDVMYDATLFYKEKARKPQLPPQLDIRVGDFALCTIHRAENTDDPQRLKNIFQGLADSNASIVFPMHPRTKGKVANFGIAIPENVWAIDPVGYLEMVWMEANCRLVATDSGGVQKEAYFFGKPCVTMRDETEWVELVEAGWNTLVGSNAKKISDALSGLSYPESTEFHYGKGNAAELIVDILCSLKSKAN